MMSTYDDVYDPVGYLDAARDAYSRTSSRI